MAKPVRFLYSGIRVRSLETSLGFYRRLGFRVVARGTMEHGGRWVHLRFPRSRHRLEFNFYPKGTRYYEPFRGPGTEFDHLGFLAPDVAGWLRKVTRAGGRLELDFTEGRTRIVYLRDPNGIWLEAFGPARPRPRRRRAARRQ